MQTQPPPYSITPLHFTLPALRYGIPFKYFLIQIFSRFLKYIMLCDKCTNIEFRRSTPEDDLCHGKSSVEHIYYNHHVNQRALKVSKDYCHLCWKLWHGFKDLYSFSTKSSARVFEESAPFPIRLLIHLKDDWITNNSEDESWSGEHFWATCAKSH